MTLKELGEKRAKLWAEMKELNELTKAEARSFSAEESEKWDRLNNEYEATETEEVEAEKAEKRAKFLVDKERELNASRGRKADPDPIESRTDKKEPEQTQAQKSATEYRTHFNRYMRCEIPTSEFSSICEKRNLQADLPQSGGYLVLPQEMANGIVKFTDDLVFIRQKATKYTIPTAASLGVPTLENDPADADWTAEIANGNEDTAMNFGKRSLTPHPVAKRIRISRTLLRMATIGAEALVTARLGYKFGITEEKGFLTGSGVNQPLGVFTASNDGIGTGQDISTDNTITGITADGLINAKFGLKSQYQNSPSCAWGFSRTAVRNIRKLKDGNGQYLWSAGLSGTPSTILDIPYFMSEYVPSTFTTGLYVGIIGDWSFYWIADALSMGIQRLEELYAATNQVGFIGRKETDGMPVLQEAFVRVKIA